MKAKTVKYERLVNTGNFTHEKYGIELYVEEGESASDVMEEAIKFVKRQILQRKYMNTIKKKFRFSLGL